jgi:nucleotide-binding universal stress UspA family protein
MSRDGVHCPWLSGAVAAIVGVMDKELSVMPTVERPLVAPGSARARAARESTPAPTRAQRPRIRAQGDDREPHAEPADRVHRPAEPADMFSSVLCGVDQSVDSVAAHQQAVLFAKPGGAVAVVPTPRLTRHGDRALHDACEGHDLLALGAGAGASAVLQHAPIPVLISRWSPPGKEVTDTILVPVDDSPASRRAVEFAGRLAAVHGGTVTVLAVPPRDPAIHRAIAASCRNVLQAGGAVPTVLGEQLPRERAIPATALAINASLVVLGTGDSQNERRTTAEIADRIDASVLAVPPPGPATRGHAARDMSEAMTLVAPRINQSTKQVDRPDPKRGPLAAVSAEDDGDSRSHSPVSPPAESVVRPAPRGARPGSG